MNKGYKIFLIGFGTYSLIGSIFCFYKLIYTFLTFNPLYFYNNSPLMEFLNIPDIKGCILGGIVYPFGFYLVYKILKDKEEERIKERKGGAPKSSTKEINYLGRRRLFKRPK